MVKYKKYILVICSLVCLAVFYAFASETILSKLKTLSYIIRLVENYYVEEVDISQTIDGAIHGFLEELDPHSSYIDSEDFQYMKESLDGEFEGIGIEFAILDGYVTVISPIPGTPSDKAGLMGGDKIVKINGNSAYKITQEEVFKKLRGEKGSSVDVSIKRIGMEDLLKVSLIRDKIPIHSVMAAFMFNKQTGYIKVSRFAKQTFDEISQSIDSLESQGMNHLILDLRNNGGGLMDQAISLLDLFINSNDTLLYTKGRTYDANEVFYAKESVYDKTMPIIALINRASASASEIISGGLQDLDRGFVVGETSFGKGLVQRQFLLDDGSAARITVAKYYTPSGRLIQRDFDEGLDEYYNSLLAENREINDSSKINLPIFKTKAGREVFGGGGITPDVYISSKVTFSSKSQTILTHPNRLLFKYANNIKESFTNKYTSFAKFNKQISKNVGSNVLQKSFILWANNIDETLDLSSDDIKEDWAYLENRILANIASAIFGKDYYYYTLLNQDVQFLTSLNHIEDAILLSK